MGNKISLNRNQLKYLVIVAMLIDHIAWGFVPMESLAGQLMHFVGRLTGPTMGYFLAEGYIHTRDKRKYGMRLGIFSLLSWVPFSLFEVGYWPSVKFSVMTTLFLGFLAMWIWDQTQLSETTKSMLLVLIILVSALGDWAFYDVLWPLVLYMYRKDEKYRMRIFTVLCVWATVASMMGRDVWWTGLCNLGILLVPLILKYFYNGEKGSSHSFHKWFFYIFYPLHLIVLYCLKRYWI